MKPLLWMSLLLPLSGATLDLRNAAVVRPAADAHTATVLVEEIEKRTGLRLPAGESWPEGVPVIAITSGSAVPSWKRPLPASSARAEGFRLFADSSGPRPAVWILGADKRGALFGAGQLLRLLEWQRGQLDLATPLDLTTSPAYPIRGHQLGYRATANSWDAWTVAQFEQYIRDLALFGTNSIENIPFEDDRKSPHFKVPRREMNRALAEICARYGLDYWVWTPATFDLNNREKRDRLLAEFDRLFRDVPALTGVFFPGGDPGDNPPELVLAFLEEVAARLRPVHPRAKVWLSMQGFSAAKTEVVHRFLNQRVPEWFGGIVAGPSSPPLAETRRRLPAQVPIRWYPDITHNKISQYEVPEWDQAYALTLGREAINPRPAEYAAIFRRYAPFTGGFLAYSDGVHDDVNKVVFSALAWDPSREVSVILSEYARWFFSPSSAPEMADALLALERNWRGPLADNGGVEATLLLWNRLEARHPELAGNWRWQMCLLRANYDAFVRRRLRQDTALEQAANAQLVLAAQNGPEAAMAAAQEILQEAVARPAGTELRQRIEELAERLFSSIGLQTSVRKYHASGAERGAVLDFLDNPLNNRWWLEDEFAKVRTLPDRAAQVARLAEIAAWENPGPGSFYDNLGHRARSPRAVPRRGADDGPLFWWWDQGKSRARLSWQVTEWPAEMVYEGLDPDARYVVKTTGYGQALLRIDGEKIAPTVDGRLMHEFKLFPVPPAALRDGKLVLTWDAATGEEHLNWRQHSRLAEVWLLKQ